MIWLKYCDFFILQNDLPKNYPQNSVFRITYPKDSWVGFGYGTSMRKVRSFLIPIKI